MGRQLRRVDPNFDWPLNEVWDGFLNPYYKHCHDCPDCENGYSLYGQRLQNEWYGYTDFDAASIGAEPLRMDSPALHEHVVKKIEWSQILAEREGRPDYYTNNGTISFDTAVSREIVRMYGLWKNQWAHQLCQEDVDALVEAGRLSDFTRRPFEGMDMDEYIRTRAYFLWKAAGCPESDGTEFYEKASEEYSNYWMPFDNGRHPTAKEVNAWSMHGMGHDSINSWVCIEARAKREGKDPICKTCNGSGSYWDSPELKQKAEEWEAPEPPAGDAYQIWETVSEGSPVSPPFMDPEELAEWMVANDTSVTSDNTKEDWMKFILGPGWSPSGMMLPGHGYVDGVKANALLDSDD